MKVYRILFSENSNNWMSDDKICIANYRPNSVDAHHFPAADNFSAIAIAKLALFDKAVEGLSLRNTSYIIQSYDDGMSMWDSILEYRSSFEESSDQIYAN